MKMINNIRNYLEDKDYYIDMFENKLHVFNYDKLIKLTDKSVVISFIDFKLDITGNNLKTIGMDKSEILLEGNIDNVRIIR